MAAITDAFTDTTGTNLEAHVSPGGQTWSRLNGANPISLAANKIDTYNEVNGSAVYLWNLPAISNDLTFSIDYVMPVTSPDNFFFSLTLRGAHPSGFTGYVAIITRTAGVLTFELHRDITFLGTVSAGTLDDGLVHTLTLKAQGSLITLWIDGVKKITANDLVYSTQSQSRININNVLAGVLPVGFYLDNVSIDVAPSQPLTLAPLTQVISGGRSYIGVRDAVFYFLTGGRRNLLGNVNTQGGSGGGTPPPITGQLWPRGQKTG